MSIRIKEIKNSYRVTLHKVNEKIIGELNFNAIQLLEKKIDDYSKLDFCVKKYYYSQINKETKKYPLYDEIKSERLIGLDGELYVIKNITEDDEKGIKNCTAYSIEKKLEKNYMNITTRIGFYLLGANEEDESKFIYSLDDYMYDKTGWRFGHIDKEILYRKSADISQLSDYNYGANNDISHDDLSYRNYESVDTDWYNFLNNDLSEQYECIIDFDNKNKLVNMYHLDRFGDNFGIMLSYDNYIKSLERELDSSDIITMLILEGNEEKCIVESELVTGNNYIENYNYFIENNEMSEELANALNEYQMACETRHPLWVSYKNQLVEKKTILNTKQDIEYRYLQEIPRLESMLNAYVNSGLTEQANRLALELQEKKLKESEVAKEIAILENEILQLNNNIAVLNNLCKKKSSTTIDKNESIAYDSQQKIFNDDLLNELKLFIYSEYYTNDAFYDAKEIISAGTRILENKSKPTREWNLDVKDFTKRLNPNNFRENWRGILGLGDIVILLNYDKNISEFIYVTGWKKDFNKDELSITLSNKKSTKDSTKVIADVLKTAMTNNRSVIRNKCLTNNERYHRI